MFFTLARCGHVCPYCVISFEWAQAFIEYKFSDHNVWQDIYNCFLKYKKWKKKKKKDNLYTI